MGFRPWGLLCALLLLVSACGGEEGSRPATTHLPLQPSGLAVGGDVQSRATDEAKVAVTEQQVRQIADACRDATELPQASDDPCAVAMREVFHRNRGKPCRAQDPCLRAVRTPSARHSLAGYFEITDSRPPGRSLCGSGHVCLRVGVSTVRVLDQVVGPATSTGPVTPTTRAPAPAPTRTGPAPVPSPVEPGPPTGQPGMPAPTNS